MSDKEVLHKFRGDKQKQSGCLNGIFQIFDHRFRRNDHNHMRLPPGKEKNKVTPRNSASSSSWPTATSSLDCSKRVQTEASSSSQSVVSESCSSASLHRKQTELFMQSPDIRNVVKDSMTREPRAVSVKTVAKDERVGPVMKHVDSPRPYEMTRFSCDERESRYQMKSDMKIKEFPRLSLDSNSASDPISNKRASSSVVARLMGLEALTPSIDKSKTLKTNSCLNEELVSNSKSSRKEEELKHVCTSVSARVHKAILTKVPLETAPWKREGGGQGPQKPPFKSKEGPPRAERVSRAIYDEIEKRLTEHEFETTGEDLRAVKKILEAIQKPKKRLENKEHALNQRVDQSVSHIIIQRKVKHAEARQDTVARKRLKDPNVRDRRVQRSKNIINGPPHDSSRPKKQPGKQRSTLGSTSRHPKTKSMDPLQDSSETRNSSQQNDTVSFQSNDSEVTGTEWAVNSPFQPKEWLTEKKSTVDHAKHTTEQPSPVSVLDAVYTEETPSPIKKKVTAFNDDENLRFKEVQDQYSEFSKTKLERIKNLVHQIKLLNTNTDDETGDQRYVEEIILASGCLRDPARTTIIAQLHPTVGFINPELFNALEKTDTCTETIDDGYSYNKEFMRSRIRRKLVFDTVNDVLGYKFVMFGPFGPHRGRTLNADKLLKEIWSEVDGLQYKSETSVSNEDDEASQVTRIVNADVNKRSREWDEYCSQVPELVLDIERLIFKDLICEVVNGQVTGLQVWPRKPHCRRLFPV